MGWDADSTDTQREEDLSRGRAADKRVREALGLWVPDKAETVQDVAVRIIRVRSSQGEDSNHQRDTDQKQNGHGHLGQCFDTPSNSMENDVHTECQRDEEKNIGRAGAGEALV